MPETLPAGDGGEITPASAGLMVPEGPLVCCREWIAGSTSISPPTRVEVKSGAMHSQRFQQGLLAPYP